MLAGLRGRLTFANVTSVIALFVALGGGAYAAVSLPKNSVGTKQLKKNAVTGVKIKNNAITAAKVKNGSLTGSDINVATLGKVPSAANADHAATADNATHAAAADSATNAGHAGSADSATTAGTADNLTPPEDIHYIGASGEPPFLNGSLNYPDAAGPPVVKYPDAGFWKDKEGVVHLTGIIESGTSPFMFALPAGYRPASGTATALSAYCNNCSDTDSNSDTYNQASTLLLVIGAGLGSPFPDGGVAVNGPPGTTVALDGLSFRAQG